MKPQTRRAGKRNSGARQVEAPEQSSRVDSRAAFQYHNRPQPDRFVAAPAPLRWAGRLLLLTEGTPGAWRLERTRGV